MFDQLEYQRKISFFQKMVSLNSGDMGKIAFLWLSCSSQRHIREKLEKAFKDDIEDCINIFSNNGIQY